MAFSENLAKRIRESLANLPNVEEKKMFGGLAFMVDDKMCLTAGPDCMMCRVDPALHDDLVIKDGCRTVIMRNKAYKGYIYVDENAVKTKEDFHFWIALALDFNKKAKASVKKRKVR
jgi:TfoX/Sxy family transcriptional regulator of competence genes